MIDVSSIKVVIRVHKGLWMHGACSKNWGAQRSVTVATSILPRMPAESS